MLTVNVTKTTKMRLFTILIYQIFFLQDHLQLQLPSRNFKDQLDSRKLNFFRKFAKKMIF